MGGNSGSRASTEPVPVSALTGFDPGRITEMLKEIEPRILEPIIRKAADNFYCQLLDSVDGYLLENIDHNMKSHINMLERENKRMRTELWEADIKLSRQMLTGETRIQEIDALQTRLNRALNRLAELETVK